MDLFNIRNIVQKSIYKIFQLYSKVWSLIKNLFGQEASNGGSHVCLNVVDDDDEDTEAGDNIWTIPHECHWYAKPLGRLLNVHTRLATKENADSQCIQTFIMLQRFWRQPAWHLGGDTSMWEGTPLETKSSTLGIVANYHQQSRMDFSEFIQILCNHTLQIFLSSQILCLNQILYVQTKRYVF